MGIVAELLDLVLPASCVACSRPGTLWCGGCRPLSSPELVAIADAPPVYGSGAYAGELRTALLAYKERRAIGLAPALAGYLADAVDVAVRAGGPHADPPVLVPVPSARPAARQRGGDHVRRLARLVARESSMRLVPALRLSGPVADSAGLTRDQRSANLSGRMRAVPAGQLLPCAGPAVIVDDIVTTGTTLTEAGRALRAAGWLVAGAAVVGVTHLRAPARRADL